MGCAPRGGVGEKHTANGASMHMGAQGLSHQHSSGSFLTASCRKGRLMETVEENQQGF